jgi:serine/threonine-protein kinase
MAPEQLEGKEPDARTDIYALCLVLYEMITARRVFEAATQASLIAAILKDKPRPLTDLQPIAPPQLDRVVQTGLEKDPGKRWQSARELKHALDWIGLEAPAKPVTASAPGDRLWKGLAAALAVAAVAALVLAWLPAETTSEWRLDIDTGERRPIRPGLPFHRTAAS